MDIGWVQVGCERLDAGYEDYSALVWRRGEEGNELVAKEVVAKDIGCEDLAERRLILFAVIVFIVGIPGACLRSGSLAGDAQLVRRISE